MGLGLGLGARVRVGSPLAMPKVGREVGASSARTSYLAALAGPHVGWGWDMGRVRVRLRG